MTSDYCNLNARVNFCAYSKKIQKLLFSSLDRGSLVVKSTYWKTWSREFKPGHIPIIFSYLLLHYTFVSKFPTYLYWEKDLNGILTFTIAYKIVPKDCEILFVLKVNWWLRLQNFIYNMKFVSYGPKCDLISVFWLFFISNWAPYFICLMGPGIS